MKTVNNILKIIERQVERLGKKSERTRLAEEEIIQLKILAETVVTIMDKLKPKKGRRPYQQAERVSDEDLLKYAKD